MTFSRKWALLPALGLLALGGCSGPAEGETVEQARTAVVHEVDPDEKVFDVPVGDSFVDGPGDAAVTLITFLGYQCPFSARISPTLRELRREFSRDLRVVYKQRPQRNHYWAIVSAEAVLAAGAQGKYLEMAGLLFERQEEMSDRLNRKAIRMSRPTHDDDVQRALFVDFAAELGLDADRVRRELENRTYLAQVQAESAEAVQLGATGTPSSFVNGRYIPGAKPLELFRQEIRKEIDWARGGNRPAFPVGANVAELRPARPDPKPTPAAGQAEDIQLVFDVPVGETFSVGPPDAKVTLISFLDYQ